MIRVFLSCGDSLLCTSILHHLALSRHIEAVGHEQSTASSINAVKLLTPDVVVFVAGTALDELMSAIQQVHQSSPGSRLLLVRPVIEDCGVSKLISLGIYGILTHECSCDDLAAAIQLVATGCIVLPGPPPCTSQTTSIIHFETAEMPDALKDERLTERERAVLAVLARGANNREIADTLCIAEGTVKFHVHRLMGKLGIHDRTKLAVSVRWLDYRQPW